MDISLGPKRYTCVLIMAAKKLCTYIATHVLVLSSNEYNTMAIVETVIFFILLYYNNMHERERERYVCVYKEKLKYTKQKNATIQT